MRCIETTPAWWISYLPDLECEFPMKVYFRKEQNKLNRGREGQHFRGKWEVELRLEIGLFS